MQLDMIDFIAIPALYIFSFQLTSLKTSSMIVHTFIYKHYEARHMNFLNLVVWFASFLALSPPF